MSNLRMSLQATAPARYPGHLEGGTIVSLVRGMSVPPIEEEAFVFVLVCFILKAPACLM